MIDNNYAQFYEKVLKMAKIGEFQWNLQIAIKLTFLVRISPNMVCMDYIQQNFQKSQKFSISLFFGDVTAKMLNFW